MKAPISIIKTPTTQFVRPINRVSLGWIDVPFEGENGSAIFVNNGEASVTFGNTSDRCVLTNTVSRFGSTCLDCKNGTGPESMVLQVNGAGTNTSIWHSDFGAWKAEYYLRFPAMGGTGIRPMQIFYMYMGAVWDYIRIQKDNTKLYGYTNHGGATTYDLGSFATNTWYKITILNQGSYPCIFIDDVLKCVFPQVYPSTANTQAIDYIYLASSSADAHPYYIDNFRLIRI